MELREKEVNLTETEKSGFRERGRTFRYREKELGYKEEAEEDIADNEINIYFDTSYDNKKVSDYNSDKLRVGSKKKKFKEKSRAYRTVKKLSKRLVGNEIVTKMANNNIHNVSEEYKKINEDTRNIRRSIIAVGTLVTTIVKATISFFSSALGIGLLIIGIAVTTLIISVQTVTYSVIVDEEANIRALVSQISSELSNDINEIMVDNDCDVVSTSGRLSEWKEIIALWWTLKMNLSDNEQYENYFNGDDYEDLKYLFYQFNQVNYEVIDNTTDGNSTGHRLLKISITNTSLDELRIHWGLTEEQNKYLDELLAAEDVWNEILFSNELSDIAYRLMGQSSAMFIEWYPLTEEDRWDTAFVMYCLNEAGYINSAYFDKTSDAKELIAQCMEKGWFKVAGIPSEGDIIFLNINGTQQCGIVSLVEESSFNVIMGDYTNKDVVYEISLQNDSVLVSGYAHINGLFMPGINDVLIAEGQYVWPVPGYYYVTSCFGPRINPITGEGIEGHSGMDVACPIGTPIVSVTDGIVSAACHGDGYNGGMGIYVIVEHADGLRSIYMHNSELCVKEGDVVSAGQTIALSGNTGRSTGPHHHITIISNEERVDPASFFNIPVSEVGDMSQYVN